MSLEQDAKLFLGELARAFPTDPAPDSGNLTPHDCEECSRVNRLFRSHEWPELSAAALREEPAALALLSTSAHTYYIPAFLSGALLARDHDLVNTTLYDLAFAMRNRRERIAALTDLQVKCIGSWLRLVMTHSISLDADMHVAVDMCEQWNRLRRG